MERQGDKALCLFFRNQETRNGSPELFKKQPKETDKVSMIPCCHVFCTLSSNNVAQHKRTDEFSYCFCLVQHTLFNLSLKNI